MIRGAGRALAAAVLAAFGGAIWLAVVYTRSPTLHVEFDVATASRHHRRPLPPGDRTPNTQRTFAWTGETLTIDLTDVDRQVDWLFAYASGRARRRCTQS